MGRNIKKGMIIIGIIVGIGLLFWFIPTASSDAKDALGGEKRQLLSPDLFKGKTAYTYQIAKE
ncbi:MAG: hypothetical protein HZB79_10340, partial [Deltaproteobacteria bacterium]|nr:hypothetical protein [Deltaproteobacteria bacterium]